MQITRLLGRKLRKTVSLTDKVTVPKDLAANRLLEDSENPFDTLKRCKLCGTGISYKNTQLLSQFVSPYTGRLYTENASGLCNYKYKELERAHSVAKKMLLIGPAKDPIFMNDEIGAQNLKGNLSHSNQGMIAAALGLPDTKNIDIFQSLLSEEEKDSLGDTDVSKDQLLKDGSDRWLSGDQIKYLFAESEDFDSEANWANMEVSETFEASRDEDEDFDEDWVKNIDAEIEAKEKKAKMMKKSEKQFTDEEKTENKSDSDMDELLNDMNFDKPKK